MSEPNGKKKQSISSPSDSFLDFYLNPTTTAPSRAASAVANKIDQPSLNRGPMMAMLQGGLAGAIEGAGNVVSDMTSPLSIATALTGGAISNTAVKGAKALNKISRLTPVAKTLDTVTSNPVRQVMPKMDDVEALLADMRRNVARVPNATRPPVRY